MLAKRTKESHPCFKDRSPINIFTCHWKGLGFVSHLRDPIKYIFTFVLIAVLTVGWIVAAILCKIAENNRKAAAKELKDEYVLKGFTPTMFWTIFGCFFAVGCIISLFVLVNLTRQRRSVS